MERGAILVAVVCTLGIAGVAEGSTLTFVTGKLCDLLQGWNSNFHRELGVINQTISVIDELSEALDKSADAANTIAADRPSRKKATKIDRANIRELSARLRRGQRAEHTPVTSLLDLIEAAHKTAADALTELPLISGDDVTEFVQEEFKNFVRDAPETCSRDWSTRVSFQSQDIISRSETWQSLSEIEQDFANYREGLREAAQRVKEAEDSLNKTERAFEKACTRVGGVDAVLALMEDLGLGICSTYVDLVMAQQDLHPLNALQHLQDRISKNLAAISTAKTKFRAALDHEIKNMTALHKFLCGKDDEDSAGDFDPDAIARGALTDVDATLAQTQRDASARLANARHQGERDAAAALRNVRAEHAAASASSPLAGAEGCSAADASSQRQVAAIQARYASQPRSSCNAARQQREVCQVGLNFAHSCPSATSQSSQYQSCLSQAEAAIRQVCH